MTTRYDVLRFLGLEPFGADFPISGASTFAKPSPFTLSFSTSWDENVEAVVRTFHETCFLIPLTSDEYPNAIGCERPRLRFAEILQEFFSTAEAASIAPTARVDPSAHLGVGVNIGDFCVVERGTSIGDGSSIGHHTVIHAGVKIGAGTSVGTHGSIGGQGFGFEYNDRNTPIRIIHSGGTHIGDNVEIGNHVTIAQGTIEPTILGNSVKVDDAVFIAHNVNIGEATLITAGAQISGSVTVGKHVWISPEASVINKVSIGDNALVGIGAVVTRSVPANAVVAGVPAKQIGTR